MGGRIKTRLVGYLVSALVLSFSSLCSGQVLRVRVLNSKNGRPLPKQQVRVSLAYDQGASTPARYEALLRAETDGDGQAKFNLPQPLPSHLVAQVILGSEHWHCGCLGLAATEDVLEKGLTVGAGAEAKLSATPRAGPAEILFYARPLTFFERVLYPLMKE